MRLDGVCITTNDAPRLAEFYKIVKILTCTLVLAII